MKKPLIIRAEAEADLVEACRWYEQQVPELSAQFLLCVDAVMASIERNPQLYPIVHKSIIRRALTRRFPYAVFFIEGERHISVVGVIHAKRSPRVWKDRI
jgi:plasmid stabilization system protein ParE